MDNEMLEKGFGTEGERVKIVKGDYQGETGIILKETGYITSRGVVCKIKLDSGKVGEWSSDFWENENIENSIDSGKETENQTETDTIEI